MADSITSAAKPVAIIMAGGAGTRFWPLSRQKRPKQFLSLFGAKTLIQESLERIEGLIPLERVLIMTNRDFIPLVREQLPQIDPEHIIGEPCRRDTAAAVALAALLAEHLYGDCTLVTLTSDHCISPTDKFQETLRSAISGAQASPRALYTLGIAPTFPSVGYGYLHRGKRIEGWGNIPHYQLLEFREKPNLYTAEDYLESGEYYWNSGMFVWQSSAILGELKRNIPDHLIQLQPTLRHFGTASWEEELAAAFEGLRKISIDFAVMERAEDVRMVEANFQWYDVGDWLALRPFLDTDEDKNSYRGTFVSFNAHNNIVFNEDDSHKIALVGIDDIVVVRDEHHTLVVSRDKLQEVKRLVSLLPPEEQ